MRNARIVRSEPVTDSSPAPYRPGFPPHHHIFTLRDGERQVPLPVRAFARRRSYGPFVGSGIPKAAAILTKVATESAAILRMTLLR